MTFIIRASLWALLIFMLYQLFAGLRQPPLTQEQQLCQTPIAWRLGTIAPDFNLSEAQALAAIRAAAGQWNDIAMRQLFVQDTKNGFPIDFRYDARQEALLRKALLQRQLNQLEQWIDPRKTTLQDNVDFLRRKIVDFEQRKAQLNSDFAQLKQQAATVASQEHADRLNAELERLNRRQTELNEEAARLNEEQHKLKQDNDSLNDSIREHNRLIADHRAESTAQRQGQFEVGQMKIQGKQRQMTIYAFLSTEDLVATIAHEFGHALGIGHTDEPSSLMYPLKNAAQLEPTSVDLQALIRQCPRQMN